MNVEQTFQLMDSLLPYEICSYHQILPLAVQGESLILGMVDPQNVSVLDYVRPILKPKNYFIKRRTLEGKVYKEVLAQYKEYQKQQRVEEEGDDSIPTLIFGNESLKGKESMLKNGAANTALKAEQLKAVHSGIQLLEVKNRYGSSPAATLAQLPPHELLLELFGRSLGQNITQLLLERQQTSARIIWSRNGRSQLLLDRLPLPLFQGLIHELKRLTDFPVQPVDRPRKVEMLRLYENQPLLLRLRFVPGKFGEQAAVQLFRGQLLQKYQKSQMAKLSQEITQITGLLDQKLRQASARSQINPEKIEALAGLQKSFAQMSRSVDIIKNSQVKW
jgi:type II secretory ATPase GspE/PulE/Tfp pilus assembly ATPase PilB-like protein